VNFASETAPVTLPTQSVIIT